MTELDKVEGFENISTEDLIWVRVDGTEVDVESVKDQFEELKEDPSVTAITEDMDFVITGNDIEISRIPEFEEIVKEISARVKHNLKDELERRNLR